jgi:hypothetical protein
MQTLRVLEPFGEGYQPGGTATIIFGRWISRLLEKGNDSFDIGRWSFQVLHGKGLAKVMLVTGYNVCQQSMATAGDRMAYMQQSRYLLSFYSTSRIAANPKSKPPICPSLVSLAGVATSEQLQYHP